VTKPGSCRAEISQAGASIENHITVPGRELLSLPVQTRHSMVARGVADDMLGIVS